MCFFLGGRGLFFGFFCFMQWALCSEGKIAQKRIHTVAAAAVVVVVVVNREREKKMPILSPLGYHSGAPAGGASTTRVGECVCEV